MKITVLVENKSEGELKAMHGLSFYIETEKHKILFDLGPDKTIFENSKKLNIDLGEVDTVIISHGHMDHGGALEQFLQINKKAKVYIQVQAFEKHYSKLLFFKINIGLNPKWMNHPQIVLINGDAEIDDELKLFRAKSTERCYSSANQALYSEKSKDKFEHEHHLIIENQVLIMGCGHSGLINILDTIHHLPIKACIGGYHLYHPLSKKTSGNTALLDEMVVEMNHYHMAYYTCHCTGEASYQYFQSRVENMHYLSTGKVINI